MHDYQRLPWTASINLKCIIICDDNVDGASGRNNVVGKTPFELLDASPKDDPAGAPVVGRYLNSHVGQMVRSAPEQRKHTPGGGKEKQRALIIYKNKCWARQRQAEATSAESKQAPAPTCNSLGLHRCHHRLDRLCCHRLHVPTPNNTCKEFRMALQRCVCFRQ